MGKYYFKYTNSTEVEKTVAREGLDELIERAKELMIKYQLPFVNIRRTIENESGKVYPHICTVQMVENEQFEITYRNTNVTNFTSPWLQGLTIQQAEQTLAAFMEQLTQNNYIDDSDKMALWSIAKSVVTEE